MRLVLSPDPRPVHFMGIGGAGMSALAELFHRRGAAVDGCDNNPDGATDLAALGVRVARGHDPSHLEGARALVYTSAVPKDHPELLRAQALGIPVIRRAEALAEACAGGRLVGVAGTHGKSTTTVMTTKALEAAGLAPTGIVGARVSEWGGNLSAGDDALFVVEADEYDRSFLALHPDAVIVTNVEADHLDIYADLDDIRATFAEFVRRGRFVVLCADDPGANALPSPATAEVIRYGVAAPDAHPDARLVARDVLVADGRTSFGVVFDGKPLGAVQIGVPGLHNVRNALAALATGILLGVTLEQMAPGLRAFTGVERRFQRLGEARGIAVVDDYAHHPTEIAATLQAARAAYPGRRLVACFQPHLYSRTRDFAAEFGQALAAADVVALCELYPAREQPIAGIDAGTIAREVERAGRAVTWRGPRADAPAGLQALARAGDVVFTIGAGDITKVGPELLARLA